MDTAIQHYARTHTLRSPDHYRVGPFTVRHNPAWELKFANYAIPDQDAEPTARDVRRPGRGVPRARPAAQAGVPARLGARRRTGPAGSRLHRGEPRARSWPAPPTDCSHRSRWTGSASPSPSPTRSSPSAAAVQHTGFGGEGGPDDGEIAWLRGGDGGRRRLGGRHRGRPARRCGRLLGARRRRSANWPAWPSPTPSAAGASARRCRLADPHRLRPAASTPSGWSRAVRTSSGSTRASATAGSARSSTSRSTPREIATAARPA